MDNIIQKTLLEKYPIIMGRRYTSWGLNDRHCEAQLVAADIEGGGDFLLRDGSWEWRGGFKEFIHHWDITTTL
jgi:hypothetical protein